MVLEPSTEYSSPILAHGGDSVPAYSFIGFHCSSWASSQALQDRIDTARGLEPDYGDAKGDLSIESESESGYLVGVKVPVFVVLGP